MSRGSRILRLALQQLDTNNLSNSIIEQNLNENLLDDKANIDKKKQEGDDLFDIENMPILSVDNGFLKVLSVESTQSAIIDIGCPSDENDFNYNIEQILGSDKEAADPNCLSNRNIKLVDYDYSSDSEDQPVNEFMTETRLVRKPTRTGSDLTYFQNEKLNDETLDKNLKKEGADRNENQVERGCLSKRKKKYKECSKNLTRSGKKISRTDSELTYFESENLSDGAFIINSDEEETDVRENQEKSAGLKEHKEIAKKETKKPTCSGKKITRNDSELTYFHSENGSDDTFFDNNSGEEAINESETRVGSGGLRKCKKVSKRVTKKLEKSLGAGKAVQPNPCTELCPNGCRKKFTEQKRHNIFEFFWGIGNHQRQRDWLLSCVREVDIKRRKCNSVDSRRSRSYEYVIPWEDENIRVCQQFILKTLDISQMTLRYTKTRAISYKCSKVDQRGRHEPTNKTPLEITQQVHTFIKKLPAVSSHYCRNNTTRKYLLPEVRNVSFLYKLFVRDYEMSHNNIKPKVSLKVFRKIFSTDFNLGIHLPKKDKCNLCEARKQPGFQCSESEQKSYKSHITDKEESKSLFLKDQERAKSETNFICASFDLQKVLNTPHGDNMLLYYSRKYAVYNETVYESGTREAYCYLWGESDAKRGCNEICTILYKYLGDVDKRGHVSEIALYCDSCTGQNRNRAMISMLHVFLTQAETVTKIKIIYLLPGHTYMPVDSVHATIERFVRRRIIWAPSEWATLISNARTIPKPYKVIEMTHSDFSAWKDVAQEVLPNKVTKTKEEIKIDFQHLRIASFEKNSRNIKVRYSYDPSDRELTIPFRNRRKVASNSAKNAEKVLYARKLPISILKYKDLCTLCDKEVIPRRYWREYKEMPNQQNIIDTLPETDAEDEEVP